MFSAYNIRKMLPKLVVAVIAIQLSWYLGKFVIDLSNDFGKGIADLMYAPFNPVDVSNIESSLGRLGGGALTLGSLFSLGLLTVGTISAINLGVFGLLLLALPVMLAVLVGYFVLVLRQILIVLSMIFIPIAIAAWVLPGTERYWKLWKDNFIKLLMMYPMIMAMIAGGRIFGYIGADQGGLQGLIILLMGFFAPLFILPKTFKWGGAALGAISGAVIQASSKPRGYVKEEAKGFKERRQGEAANSYTPSDSLLQRTQKRIRSGSYIPTERSRRLAIAKGDKWSAEKNDEAAAYVERVRKKTAEAAAADGDGGVGASKEALVQLVGHEDKRVREAAIKKLIDTSSWIEVQNSYFDEKDASGNVTKKRVFETKDWQAVLNNNPEYYGKTLGSRPDLAAHVLQTTYKTKATEFDDAFKDIADPVDRADAVDKENIKRAGDMQKLYGIDRTTWESATYQDYDAGTGKYKGKLLSDADRMIYAMKEQMGNDDFAKVAQGFYQELIRVGDDTHRHNPGNPADAQRVAAVLEERLTEIESTGLRGQQILGALKGGSVEGDVNKALRGDGRDPRTIADFVHDPGMPVEAKVRLPAAANLQTNVNVRNNYKMQLLTPGSQQGKTIAYALGNSTLPSAEQAEQQQVLGELKATAATSPQAAAAYNDIVDQIHRHIDARHQNLIKQAIASGRPQAQVDRYKDLAENAALSEMAKYEKV